MCRKQFRQTGKKYKNVVFRNFTVPKLATNRRKRFFLLVYLINQEYRKEWRVKCYRNAIYCLNSPVSFHRREMNDFHLNMNICTINSILRPDLCVICSVSVEPFNVSSLTLERVQSLKALNQFLCKSFGGLWLLKMKAPGQHPGWIEVVKSVDDGVWAAVSSRFRHEVFFPESGWSRCQRDQDGERSLIGWMLEEMSMMDESEVTYLKSDHKRPELPNVTASMLCINRFSCFQ